MAVECLGGLLLGHLVTVRRLPADVDRFEDLRRSGKREEILVVDLFDLEPAGVPRRLAEPANGHLQLNRRCPLGALDGSVAPREKRARLLRHLSPADVLEGGDKALLRLTENLLEVDAITSGESSVPHGRIERVLRFRSVIVSDGRELEEVAAENDLEATKGG